VFRYARPRARHSARMHGAKERRASRLASIMRPPWCTISDTHGSSRAIAAASLNLYIASHRHHATLEPKEVPKIVNEILIELVGATRSRRDGFPCMRIPARESS